MNVNGASAPLDENVHVVGDEITLEEVGLERPYGGAVQSDMGPTSAGA